MSWSRHRCKLGSRTSHPEDDDQQRRALGGLRVALALRSPESSGTVVGTDLPVGSAVERGTAALIAISSGPASQDGRNGDEDAALTSTPETPPATMQPSRRESGPQFSYGGARKG